MSRRCGIVNLAVWLPAVTFAGADARAKSNAMSDPRLAAALDRIDRALDRLETGRAAEKALAERHARLRKATGEAIAGLDRLIAEKVR